MSLCSKWLKSLHPSPLWQRKVLQFALEPPPQGCVWAFRGQAARHNEILPSLARHAHLHPLRYLHGMDVDVATKLIDGSTFFNNLTPEGYMRKFFEENGHDIRPFCDSSGRINQLYVPGLRSL